MKELLIGGIPAITLVFGLVEFSKKMGLGGKWLTILSMVLGVALAMAIQLTTTMPTDAAGWLTAICVGLAYGATASGAYDFLDKRTTTA